MSEINQIKKRIYYCHHWRRLGASFGGWGRHVSAEIFFIRPPPNAKFGGGRRGTHCYLELNVGSVLSVLTLYILPYFTLLRLICASFWLGLAKYRNQPYKY